MSIPLILTTPGGGGSATPGGNTGDIQYNNAGVLGGEALVPLAHGGTNADLSASGSTTAFLAQNASHVVTARSIIAADVPNLDASKITSGVLATAQGGVAQVLTAGQGGFFGILENLSSFVNNTTSAGNLGANNTVYGVQFVLKAQYKVSKIVWIASNPSGTAVAPVMDVGIYNADASSLLLHSGAVSVVTTAQTTYNTSITPVTLNPGVYTLAYAGNATSGITNISYFPVQVNPDISAIFNTNGTRWWSKASAATAGALPASISTPATRATNGSYAPLVWFEP